MGAGFWAHAAVPAAAWPVSAWAGLAIGCAAFAGIVRWEEQRLLGRFGDGYRTYLAEVPRWVPRPPGAGKDRRRCINRPRLIGVEQPVPRR